MVSSAAFAFIAVGRMKQVKASIIVRTTAMTRLVTLFAFIAFAPLQYWHCFHRPVIIKSIIMYSVYWNMVQAYKTSVSSWICHKDTADNHSDYNILRFQNKLYFYFFVILQYTKMSWCFCEFFTMIYLCFLLKCKLFGKIWKKKL